MQANELENLLKEHPEYKFWKANRELYQDLYAGGAQLKSNAENYLYRRLREPVEVYQERMNRAFYENHIGSIVDWFASTLFRREPIVSIVGDSSKSVGFFRDLLRDADTNGTHMADFLRKKFIQSLVYGKAWIGLELPKSEVTFQSRLEEEVAGADRTFFTDIDPMSVTNWKYDTRGALEAFVIQLSSDSAPGILHAQETVAKYLVYTRKEYFRIERTTSTDKAHIRIEEQGFHSCHELNRVPVFELGVSPGLWLLNKAGHLQLEHFNKLNSLAWSLGTALYTTPVIYSRKEWNQIIGESYYIHLDPDDKFTWTEPAGNVFNIAMNNLVRLQEEIYRTCHLPSQSRASTTSSQQISATSKKRDYQITEEVLRAYGDSIKDLLKRLLEAVRLVRNDDVQINISGLDEFEVGELGEQIAEATELIKMGIQSKTFKQEVFKKLSLKYLADSDELVKQAIQDEIETSINED